VPAKVVTGTLHARMVFVPVYINGVGPYLFALDTGAAKSVIDTAVANHLGLPDKGPLPGGITGVTSSGPASQVAVDNWRVGSLTLPSETAVTVALPAHQGGSGLDGLLGSDELSRFRVVTINYSSPSVTFR
jgi:predicted aspartyl protease